MSSLELEKFSTNLLQIWFVWELLQYRFIISKSQGGRFVFGIQCSTEKGDAEEYKAFQAGSDLWQGLLSAPSAQPYIQRTAQQVS